MARVQTDTETRGPALLTQSLQRIADIVKRLKDAYGKELEMTSYMEGSKMLTI
jgi:hypothetical protein